MKNFITLISFVMLFGFSYSQTTLSDSLQLYYPFNGNAIDESGKGHNGVVVNATLTTDRFGNDASAYEFDGSFDYILTNSSFDYVNRSVSLWVEAKFILGSMPYNHVVLSQDDFQLNHGLFRLDFDNGTMNMWAGGVSNTYSTDGFLFVDRWSHFVLIRDSDFVYYYIDSHLVYRSSANNYGSTENANRNLVIGAGRNPDYQFFVGKIDNIRIYNRVLSQDEVEEIFNSYSPSAIEENEIVNNSNSHNISLVINTDGAYLVRLIDLSGRLIYEENISDGHFNLSKSKLVSGLYLVQVISNNRVGYTSKIFVN